MKGHVWILAVMLLAGCLSPESTSTTSSTAKGPATITSLPPTIRLDTDYVVIMSNDTAVASTASSTTSTTAQNGQTTSTSMAPASSTSTTLNPLIKTFTDNGRPICTQDGRPIIRMYGKMKCEHCVWVAPVFDKVMREYMANGSIIAHHWLFDNNGNGMDGNDTIPQEDSDLFFGTHQQTVPYFNFGCRFTRSGNGYYVQNRPDLEEAEFKAVINQLLAAGA